jgi:murein DD-endopeptidase MepM/ murein hydrolase activator NlpD
MAFFRCRTVALTATLAGLTVVGVAVPHGEPSTAVVPERVLTGAYRVPVDGAVLRLFDPPPLRWSRGHRGVDLAAAPDGVARSPGDGVVAFSGTVVDRGVVTVAHPDGLRSSLEPVEDAPVAGTPVAAGDPVGTVSESAHCGGTLCVHWGVRRGDNYLDPLDLIGVEPVVLLPSR